MGVKRLVDTSFWTDGKVDEFSPEDKYFMLYLLTNPFTTQLGIYEISIKQVAFQMGYSVDAVKVLLDRFESNYEMIIFSRSTNEIAIKNFLRHSIIKGGKPVEDCIKREMSKVKNKSLISEVFCHISDKDDLNATVKKIINEFQNENQNDNDNDNANENDNDNDNDNDVSYPVSYHDSCNDSYHDSLKRKHGKFENVLLTDNELQKLKDDYSDWEEKIERLSSYMKSTGKTYADHYATIVHWSADDTEKETETEQPNTFANSEYLRKRAEALKKQFAAKSGV